MSPVPNNPDPAQYADARKLSARADLHIRFTTATTPWPTWVIDRLRLTRVGSLLEVGCGPGWLWEEVRDRSAIPRRLVLTDRSPGMVREAATRVPEATMAVADAMALPFADRTFDVVVANHMLYHVRDIERALGELRRVLLPGGRLVAATNGVDHMAEIDALVGERVRQSFTLENGAGFLEPLLSDVQMERYVDELLVTDADAAVAYLASYKDLGPEVDRIRSTVAVAIERSGAFLVSKSVGLFTARR